MKALRRMIHRLRGALPGRRSESDLDEELESHIQMQTEDNLRRGMPPEVARREALLKFGGIEGVKESYRDQRGAPVLEAFFADLRYALRGFMRSPGFTLTSLAALTLGIAATTGVFSAVNGILFKPLHVPDRFVVLVTLYAENGHADGDPNSSPPQFNHWRMQTDVLQDVSAFFRGVMIYTGGDAAEEWTSMKFSADAFRCLGIRVLQGRTFTEEEDRPNGPHVAVISEQLWENRFGRDPQILGKPVLLDGDSYTVIGIVENSETMRRDFGFREYPQVYVPFQAWSEARDSRNHYFFTVARLKPGVSIEQARDRLKVSSQEYRSKFPDGLGPDDFFSINSLRELYLSSDIRSLVAIFLSAAGLVLLIGCANVANLLLARGAGREREIAIRSAIGAGRRRVVRQLMTENLLLSLTGGALGAVLGVYGMRALDSLNNPDVMPQIDSAIDMDWRVMLFALAVSLATAAVFGLLPALQASRTDLNTIHKSSGPHSRGGMKQSKARAALVVSEVGLAVILLIGSLLLIRSFVWLARADRGFDTMNTSTVRTYFSAAKYRKPGVMGDAVDRGLERLRSLPGVVVAGATGCMPLRCSMGFTFDIPARPAPEPGEMPFAGWNSVSPGFFEALRVPIKKGRGFSLGDNHSAPQVAIINEAMAKKYWKDRDPLLDRIIIAKGMGMDYLDEPVRQIVGVVGDMRVNPADAQPIMYVPIAQVSGVQGYWQSHLNWVIRTESQPYGLATAIRDELRRATGLPSGEFHTVYQWVAFSINDQQMLMLLMTILASAALLLASVGIYGVMAYNVEQRTQEIGIRIALGAEANRVRNMVVRQGASIAAVGLAIGLAAAWGLARTLESFLVGVRAHDSIVFVAVPMILGVVALLAVWLPATRASRVNPVDSLRCE
jgi:predicted permease